VSRRRLIPIALVVTLLLAVVAIAARGRPLGKSSGQGAGLPTTFWSFVFTTLVIAGMLLVVLALVALALYGRELLARERVDVVASNRRTLRTILILILGVAVLTFVARRLNLQRLHPSGSDTTPVVVSTPAGPGPAPSPGEHVQFQWVELVVILALLLALGAAAWFTRARLGPGTRRRGDAPKTLAVALDESLEDLRSDPDLRRAIIAAYARMERALAAAGIPRDPAETPLEYVERALLNLDASASAIRKLTDLFEWARFSHHEPDPSMRDEAIDALVAVRDELRATELMPA
jgi:hypothetical protein